MQKVLEDDYLLASIFGALPGSVLLIRAIGQMYKPWVKEDNIAIIASLVSKKWHEVKAAQVRFMAHYSCSLP